MARKYTYVDHKTKSILFETEQPNHIGDDDVHKMFKAKTKRDYLLEKSRIDLTIRTV